MDDKEAAVSRKRTLESVIRDFTPAWFAVTMGTGSISLLFHTFPYGAGSQIMNLLSFAIFICDLVLFMLFTALSVARYVSFPGIWDRMLRHPVQSLYLGAFPMGATTLLTISITLLHDNYKVGGRPLVYSIWALWYLDVAISALCCWGMMHIMITRQEHSLESVTVAWLLPTVPLVVASSAGATIAQALLPYSPDGALFTFAFSAWMVVIGLALTMMLLTLYLMRTIVYGYSKGPGILSIFFPLGPTGQSAYAILLIGRGLRTLAREGSHGLLWAKNTGATLSVMCSAAAFALWSIESMWMISAVLGFWYSLRRAPVPFRVTFWSMIFPNGVYANCTLALATAFSSHFFRVWGAIYAVVTFLLWTFVVVQTLCKCASGRIFDAAPSEEEIGWDDKH